MMTRRNGLVALALVFLVAGGAAAMGVSGNGTVVEETRDVPGFERIDLTGVGTLVLRVGSRESLRVRTDENLMRHIETEVVGNRLRLRPEPGVTIRNVTELTYTVTVTSLRAVTLSGAAEVRNEGRSIGADSFELRISGNGEADLSLEAGDLGLSISGAGEVRLRGSAERGDIEISGSGTVEARQLSLRRADVRVSGAGDVELSVTERLDVRVTGAGTVRYYGSPRVDSSVSGAGNVVSAGEDKE